MADDVLCHPSVDDPSAQGAASLMQRHEKTHRPKAVRFSSGWIFAAQGVGGGKRSVLRRQSDLEASDLRQIAQVAASFSPWPMALAVGSRFSSNSNSELLASRSSVKRA